VSPVSRLLVVGELLAEIMRPERAPLGALGRFLGPYPSGAPAIVASVAARLGAAVQLVGGVGDDAFGRAILARLRRDGVDVAGVRIDPCSPTGCAFVAYDKTGGRDFIFHIAGTAADGVPSEHVRAAAATAGWLHVSGSTLTLAPGLREAALIAVDAVTRAGGRVSLDPNVRPEAGDGALRDVRRVARAAALLTPSSGELAALELTAEELAANGAVVCETRGAQGVVVHTRDGCTPLAPPRRTEVDPTGAGDHFVGTYLAATMAGAPPLRAAELGCLVAADSVTVQGPMEAPVGAPPGWPR